MTERDDDTEDKSGKSGKGKAGGSAGGGIRLPPHKLAEVTKAFEYLDINKVAARLAEFVSEGVLRASANVQVKWENIKNVAVQNQGFALVTDFIRNLKVIMQLMHNPTRENVETLRREYNITSPMVR